VLFFGATADIVGSREKHLNIEENRRSRDLLDMVRRDYPALGSHRLLLSLNQEFASGEESVSEGDELAIFTPVSGG
jgi:MoaE-MoaD fusion protein